MRKVLLAAALISLAAFTPASAKWIELRTEHFRFLSDASPTKLREIATSLECFRAVVAKSTTGLNLTNREPLTIIVFKDDDSFDPYKHQLHDDWSSNRLVGFFSKTPERYVVAMNATLPRSFNSVRDSKRFRFGYSVVYHEYTHTLLQDAFPSLPLWLNEGIAEYYSSFFLHANSAEIGHVIPEHVAALRDGFPIPIQTLVALHDFRGLSDRETGMAYAESWAIVHTLLRGAAERRKQFARLLTLLRDGSTQAEAFAAAFPVPWSQIQKETMMHIREPALEVPVYAIDKLGVAVDAEPRPVDPAVMSAELGDLAVLSRDDRMDVPEQRFKEVLAAKPDDPRALAGLGLVEKKRKHPEAAEALYRKALAIAPDDAVAHFRLGCLLFESVDTPVSSAPPSRPLPPRGAEAREHFAAVLLAQPGNVAASMLYGMTYLADPGDRSPGIAALQATLQRDPTSWPCVLALGTLDAWAGDFGSAIALLDGWAAREAGPAEVAGFRRSLLDAVHVEAYLRAEHEGAPAAIAWLKELRGKTKDEEAVNRIRSWIGSLDASAAGPKSN